MRRSARPVRVIAKARSAWAPRASEFTALTIVAILLLLVLLATARPAWADPATEAALPVVLGRADIPGGARVISTVSGQEIARDLVSRVEAVEFQGGKAVVLYRGEEARPAQRITIDYGEASLDTRQALNGRGADVLIQLLLLVTIGRYLFWLGSRREAARVARLDGDRWRVGRR